jgi:hypothetical protein
MATAPTRHGDECAQPQASLAGDRREADCRHASGLSKVNRQQESDRRDDENREDFKPLHGDAFPFGTGASRSHAAPAAANQRTSSKARTAVMADQARQVPTPIQKKAA